MTKVEMDNLWGDEFCIKLPDEKAQARKISKKIDDKKDSGQDDQTVKKQVKSKKVPLEEKLNVIKTKVYQILGKQVEQVATIYDLEELCDYVDKAIENGCLAVDTETNNTTNSSNCKLMGLCLYTLNEKQIYVPINHVNRDTGERLANQLTEEDVKNVLSKAIDANIEILMHNGSFDSEVLYSTCGLHINATWDTMIAARLLDENEKASLKEQYISKIDPEQEKYDINELFENLRYELLDPELFALYAATDAYMTYKLYEWQYEQFQDKDLARVFQVFTKVEMPVERVVTKMELAGVKIDKEFNRRLSVKYHLLLEKCDEKIEQELTALTPTINEWKLTPDANNKPRKYASAKEEKEWDEKKFPFTDEKGLHYKLSKSKAEQLGDPINLASPTQLAILFYDILKCPVVSKKSPRGTGEDEMIALAKITKLPICNMILERRTIVKLISTYIDNIPKLLELWPDGRIRTHFNQLGADTGRFSSGGKIKLMDADGNKVEIPGINLQNIPAHEKSIRRTFCGDNIEKGEQLSSDRSITIYKSTELYINDSWVRADRLKVGDKVTSSDEELKEICKIDSLDDGHLRVYFI